MLVSVQGPSVIIKHMNEPSPIDPLPPIQAKNQNTNTALTSINPVEPPRHNHRTLMVLMACMLLICTAAIAYLLIKLHDQNQKLSATGNAKAVKLTAKLQPNEAFSKMLEQSRTTTSYKIKVKNTVVPKDKYSQIDTQDNSYDATVDMQDPKNPKLKADFSVNNPSINASGSTIWIGKDMYTHLTNATPDTEKYKDVACRAGKSAPQSPSLNTFRLTWAKTPKDDFTFNCGRAAYTQLLDLILLTNAPYGNVPILNVPPAGKANQLELEAQEDITTPNSMYQIYDPTLGMLNGRKTYSYNVLVQTTDNEKLLDVLTPIMGLTKTDTNFPAIPFDEENYGFGSPARYMTIWIDADTGELVQEHYKIDDGSVPAKYDTIINYSEFNKPVSITAPI